MKTCRWVEDGDDAEELALCQGCYAEVAGEVLVVPGLTYAWAWCNSCEGWHSLNDMKEWSGGGPHGAPQGSCRECAGRAG
jgi:hypothetical protein